jgi:hypothetical protein
MSKPIRLAPPWQVEQWFNTPVPLSLDALRGKVIVLEAFQMLCPSCVSQGLPQATRVRETFSPDEVAVIGLHTVFEHHAAMSATSLQAFLHEYRIAFPVGIDRPGRGSAIPQTMQAYQMRGTPTLVLIDAQGMIRDQHFGQVGDLLLGAQIASLVGEAAAVAAPQAAADAVDGCDGAGCAIPRN